MQDDFEPGALYEKAMASLSLGSALWYPEDSEIEIGDVGYFNHGSFVRMFNVMTPPQEYPNSGALPDDYDVLQAKRGVRTTISPFVKTSKNVSLKSRTPSEVASETMQFPQRYTFHASGGPGAVLITLEDAVAEEIQPDPAFEGHFLTNHKLWISAARRHLSQVLQEDDLVLIRGHTKIASRWVAVAFQGSGSFVVEVNQSNGASVTCDKDFRCAVRRGFPNSVRSAREAYEMGKAEGRVSAPFIEERSCLLVKYYTMKKRVWGSPKVVSSA